MLQAKLPVRIAVSDDRCERRAPLIQGKHVTQLGSVPTSGNTPRVRIAGLLGRLVYVISTGAIVQVGGALTSDRVWRLSINVESEPLEVSVRVVRSEAVPIRLANASWRHQEYALMLAFTDLPIGANAATQFESVPTGSDTPQVRIAGFLGWLVSGSLRRCLS